MEQIRLGRVRGSAHARGVPTGMVLLLAVVVLGGAFFFTDVRVLVGSSLARLLLPAQMAATQTLEGSGSLFGTVSRAGELASENQGYRDEIRQLQAMLAQTRDFKAENDDLRALLGLRERLPMGQLIPAQIIARDPLAQVHAVVVDRGRDDGVVPNMPLVTDRGVVGRIVEVFPTSAKALLVTDVNSGIAVRTEGADGRGSGVVRGTGDGRLVLQYVAQDEVIRPGDVVLTSGVGGVFPAGLVVGSISQIRQSDVSVFQEALVDAAVRARNLERVYILSKP